MIGKDSKSIDMILILSGNVFVNFFFPGKLERLNSTDVTIFVRPKVDLLLTSLAVKVMNLDHLFETCGLKKVSN